jgi:hypothetical protein
MALHETSRRRKQALPRLNEVTPRRRREVRSESVETQNGAVENQLRSIRKQFPVSSLERAFFNRNDFAGRKNGEQTEV